jgi:hypothetical protein
MVIYLLIGAVALIAYFEQTGAGGSSFLSSGTDSRVPFTTSDGQQGYLDSTGNVYDSSSGGNVIGAVSGSGPRPGDPGQISMWGDP